MPPIQIIGIPFGNRLYRIRNATIQDVRTLPNASYVTVTYLPPVPFSTTQTLVLVITRRTLIRNTYGRPLNRRFLQPGMQIEVDIGPAVTASEPPQAQAIQIIVTPVSSSYQVVMGTILQIDNRTRQILVGSFREPTSQIRLNITPETVIRNQRRMQVGFNALRRGQFVRADYSEMQTFSIPPQANAYRIFIL